MEISNTSARCFSRDPGEILSYIFFGFPLLATPFLGGWFHWYVQPGPLLFVSIGLCMLVLSTLRPRLAYWSLQLALLLVSMSFWSSLAMAFNQNGIEIPEQFRSVLLDYAGMLIDPAGRL